MKIGYFADGPWGYNALNKLLSDSSIEVAFIVPRNKSTDNKLVLMAEEAGIPILKFENVNAQIAISKFRSFNPDLLISMSFDQIIKSELIELASNGFINCHAGKLPFYRGRNVLNWVLINGEKEFGITVHYIDEGIDSGDIIIQDIVPITTEDDYRTLLEKAYVLCADILYKAVKSIKNGTVERRKQLDIHPTGFYCSQRKQGDEWIDWSLSSKNIHNFVRGITEPGPGARVIKKNSKIAILKTQLIPNSPVYISNPGEVVGRSQKGVVVKTGDTTILVKEIADISERGEFVNKRVPYFAIGTRLDNNINLKIKNLERRLSFFEGKLENK